jgi:hypothetical protein
VKSLLGNRIVQVACGSRDAQTLALSDEGSVFSWGDGDFGKLGRGGSEGCNTPHNIERLNNMGVCQIECGAQFSLALTKYGQVTRYIHVLYLFFDALNDSACMLRVFSSLIVVVALSVIILKLEACGGGRGSLNVILLENFEKEICI